MATFFISHSATEGSRADAVLHAVRQHFVQNNPTVFSDTLIRPSEPWRARLFHELGRCDAAVVLLDEEVLGPESRWVRREVCYLSWRPYLGSVHVRGILLDGVARGMGVSRDTRIWSNSTVRIDGALDVDAVAEETIGDFGLIECCEVIWLTGAV